MTIAEMKKTLTDIDYELVLTSSETEWDDLATRLEEVSSEMRLRHLKSKNAFRVA